MTIDKIVEQILLRHPEVSKKEILEKLEKEKKKAGGLISDETLLRMIAAELGVEIRQCEVSSFSLLIKDLVPGLNNVVVTGRVIAVFPPKTFKSNKNGKFAGLIVADKSGVLRVVMWNDKASLIESDKVKAGQLVRFSHGYTREDNSGQVELHIGERGEVEINPNNVEAKDYPTARMFSTKIRELAYAHRNKRVNVVGTVKELYSASTFKRQDSSSGKIMRFTLTDETGEISVVSWDEKAEFLEKMLKKGAQLQVVNAVVKKATNGAMELHVNMGTYVEVSEQKEEFLEIVALKEGLNHVNVKGEVATKPILREVKTSKGELVKLAVFELKDETGKIWFSAWRAHAETFSNVKVGSKIVARNAYVRKGFGNQLELSTRESTRITIES
ncbi:MAG: OB-fold nucleic acid binding domain-containing protein [Candidatus Bathyarchaeota archaeon]|jgi:replication factor A1|nr:hypothetical protein [Candidatus Bathyarchaeota archaeon A05DMB-5]MDH7556976.1 OB-fold nucleic acid binding domain-containing protein [Candidatus Bathyarchaeota archaeon]